MNLRPDRVEAAFSQAVKQPSLEAREAFLQEFCGEDEALLARLRELLVTYDGADEFLEKAPVALGFGNEEDPDVTAEFARLKPEVTGERIGPYKLLEQIGEGGFGVVWVAEQERPVRRRVALKIIKLGMDTKDVIARFEQERQALALMEHPNIAKVFDAGATQFGRPFFVMELVRGIKITDYCDHANLPTSERLKLFIQVCHAVQHAHQKGIIHRDLKPSNIMVTLHDGVPVPKVIDFGVAKATQQQRLTDLTVYTHFDQMIGTPLYMSPEQAEMSGLDIDTRSDIYSLGVLLYELLAGRTPFDPQELLKAGYDEMRRVIREQEPQKPSTFLSTMAAEVRTNVAQHRGADGAKLVSSIRGDLDWIVMKALEKDRGRRYETANGFAKDIERHLRDEPVLARPASALYRFRRMVRRNKLAFGAGAAVAAALVAGFTISVWQAVRAVSAEKRTSAVLDDLQATAPAFAEQARALAAKAQFDEAINKLDYALKLRPDYIPYLLAKADLLQCQLRLAEAAAAYRGALVLKPNDARAKANAALCEKLLAANADPQKLSLGNLSELFAAMDSEQRSAAELARVGRLLDNQKRVLLADWIARLKDLPLPAETPLKQRLKMGDDGLLSLDLSGTKITDLRPLEGVPLGQLDCHDCTTLEDLGPLRGLPLKTLVLSKTSISDFSPLKAIKTLEVLEINSTKIIDLSALRGLPLKELYISSTAVSDLSLLRGMALEILTIEGLAVTDLSPLAGMPLKALYTNGLRAKDFTPLSDLPLETLTLPGAGNVRDLEFLRRMPLQKLDLSGCDGARKFAVLSSIATLDLLVLPSEFMNLPEAEIAAILELKKHPAIQRLATDYQRGRDWIRSVRPKAEFWQEWDRDLAFLGPLRKAGAKVRRSTLPDGTWNVSLRDQPVSDIISLKGAPISELDLANTKVSDLSPLKGMPLKDLGMYKTKVTNLRPLRDLPLIQLFFDGCAPGIDVSVLAEIPTLERILLSPDPRNLDALRNLPNLKHISYQLDSKTGLPSMLKEQFWKQPLSVTELTRQRKFAEAAESLRERIKAGRSTDERLDWFKLAAVEIAGGDLKRYRATCAEMVERYKDTSEAMEREITARACGLAPDSRIAAADVAALVEGARVLEANRDHCDWFFLTSGLSEYRAGHWAEAAEQLHKVSTRQPAGKAAASALLAMTYHQQKNRDAAMTELKGARERILPQLHAKGGEQDWLVASLHLQEAEKLIGAEAPDTGKK